MDFENEWLDKSSEYFVGDISDVINRTNKLIEVCRTNGYKIIFIAHMEKDSAGPFAEGSQRVEIIETLAKKDSDVLIKKYKISPFFKTTLEQELEGITDLVVCGILANLCVRSLVHDAYDRDFDIKVIKDCCVSFDEETQDFTFKDLKATRDEVEFLNFDDFISQSV